MRLSRLPLCSRGWGFIRRLMKLAWGHVPARDRRLVFLLGLTSLIVLLVGLATDLHATELHPVRGGRLGLKGSELQVLNPLAQQTEMEQVVSRLLYRGFYQVGKERQLEPDLAEKLERSPDGRRVTVKLKSNLRFHDGQPITSRDVLASVQWMQDEANLSPQARFWRSVAVEPADPLTIVFTLPQPYTPFEWSLNFPILPAHLPIPQSRELLVGSGPFQARVTRADARGIRELRLTAFESFHQGRAFIDEIVYRAGTNGSRGQLTVTLPTERWLFFNTARSPLDQRELRKKLMEKQPLDKAITLRLIMAEGDRLDDLSEYLEAWQKNGATISIETKPAPLIEREILPERNFDLLLFRLQPGGDPDSYPFWHSSQATGSGRNLSNLKDRELDRLLEEGRLMENNDSRRAIYQKVETRLSELVPGIRLRQGEEKSLALDRAVKGASPRQGLVLADVMNDIQTYYFKEKRVRR